MCHAESRTCNASSSLRKGRSQYLRTGRVGEGIPAAEEQVGSSPRPDASLPSLPRRLRVAKIGLRYERVTGPLAPVGCSDHCGTRNSESPGVPPSCRQRFGRDWRSQCAPPGGGDAESMNSAHNSGLIYNRRIRPLIACHLLNTHTCDTDSLSCH